MIKLKKITIHGLSWFSLNFGFKYKKWNCFFKSSYAFITFTFYIDISVFIFISL